MSKLLSSGFSRLWRCKVFWICTALMLLLGAAEVYDAYRWAEYGERYIDDILFAYAPTISILSAAFISLFIGREYSDGTMRNKLVIGIRRGTVYLSNFILSSCASLLMCLVYILSVLCGLFVLDPQPIDFAEFAPLFGLSILAVLSFCAIFTAISLLCRNRAASAVICLIAAFVMLTLSVMVYDQLLEPEINPEAAFLNPETGEFVVVPSAPNPFYIGGARRVVYEFLNDFLPTGQGMQIAMHNVSSTPRVTIFSLCLIFLTTLAGCLAFQRKDLK